APRRVCVVQRQRRPAASIDIGGTSGARDCVGMRKGTSQADPVDTSKSCREDERGLPGNDELIVIARQQTVTGSRRDRERKGARPGEFFASVTVGIDLA